MTPYLTGAAAAAEAPCADADASDDAGGRTLVWYERSNWIFWTCLRHLEKLELEAPVAVHASLLQCIHTSPPTSLRVKS